MEHLGRERGLMERRGRGGIQSPYGQKHNIIDHGSPQSPLLYAMNISFVK